LSVLGSWRTAGHVVNSWLPVTVVHAYPLIQYPRIQLSAVYHAPEKKCKIKEARAKRERAVTWWNPAAQTRPVLDLSSFVPLPTQKVRIPHFHTYERERERERKCTVNVQCRVEYILLLLCLMLVMTYCT
jgi:hypothetical protein